MKKINSTILYSILALLLIGLGACKKLSSFDYPPSSSSAYDIISADGNYSYFKYIVDRSGQTDLLTGNGEHTFFVPTNGGFLNAGYTFTILQNMPVDDLTALVKNHIIAGKTDVSATGASKEETAMSNLKITVQNIGNSTFVDGGDITNRNQASTNGYINIINKLLVSRASLNDAVNSYVNNTANSQLTFLAAAITRASTGSTNFTALLSGNTSYTLFAPNNGAFIDAGYANLTAINAAAPDVLGNILKYHLIAGSKLTTAFDSVPVTAYNGTPVYFDEVVRAPKTTTTVWYANGIFFGNNVPSNIRASNGVMHVVSRVLPIPVTTTTLARINSDPNLTMFYALIQRASTADPKFNFASILADPLKSYTVFAVNNTGLQAAGYANVAAINAADPAALADILKLHMVPKRINNINIGENGTVNTLYYITNPTTNISTPNTLTFTITGGFKVKGPSNQTTIPVITGNVVTTSGILNIIGTVLTP